MKPVIRAEDLLAFVDLMAHVYENDDGARAMAKSVRTYVNALSGDEPYQLNARREEPVERSLVA